MSRKRSLFPCLTPSFLSQLPRKPSLDPRPRFLGGEGGRACPSLWLGCPCESPPLPPNSRHKSPEHGPRFAFLHSKPVARSCLLQRTCTYKAGPAGACGTIVAALALASALTKETDPRQEGERTSLRPEARASTGTSFAASLQQEAPARHGVRAGDAERPRRSAPMRTGSPPAPTPLDARTRRRPQLGWPCRAPGSQEALAPERPGRRRDGVLWPQRGRG